MQWYLINNVTIQPVPGQTTKVLAGHFIDDTKTSTAPFLAAGAILWPATDPVVAAMATSVANAQKNKGLNDVDSQTRMMAAVSSSLGGSSLQHLVIDVPLATIQGKTSGTAFAVGAALPANARLIDLNENVITALSGGGVTAVASTVQGGTDATGSLIASHSVFTGANPTNSPVGSNPYPSRGGQQLYMTLTATGGTLAGLTAGHLSLDVFYAVLI